MAVGGRRVLRRTRRSELALAGVTGTNGKTTTSFLLFAILAAAGRRPGLLGTIESRIGGERRPASAHDARGDRPPARRCARWSTWATAAARWRPPLTAPHSDGSTISRSPRSCFTNLSHDHLDFHGTLERYFEAKRSLFVADDAPPAAVNVDDEHGRRLAAELRAAGRERLVTFGMTASADVSPESLSLTRDGASFSADGLSIRTRLLGRSTSRTCSARSR